MGSELVDGFVELRGEKGLTWEWDWSWMWFSMDGLCSAVGLAKLMASDRDGDQMVLGLRI